MESEMIAALKNLTPHVLVQEPMKNHTSFKIGGPADVLIELEDLNKLGAVLDVLKTYQKPYMIMGNGSNLLVSDQGLRMAVIKISGLAGACEVEGDIIKAQAGILLSRLASVAQKAGLSGLEFASGIPGTLGGGIYMNAGAYGGEMRDVVESVTYMDADGVVHTLCKEDLDFGYRHSVFSDKNWLILSATLKLQHGDAAEIKNTMMELSKRRTEKQPLSMPSAGSVFKRPEGFFAGKLVEDAGLKGYKIGGAMVSEKHAGFIVNCGDATAQDVLDLIAHIQKVVEEQFSVKLEPEIKLIGQ